MSKSSEIQSLLEKLTLDEKAQLCSGSDFWHLHGIEHLDLPSIMVTDGPHGLRKQSEEADHIGLAESVAATCFPTASGLAATWNIDLIKKVGVTLAKECRTEQVSVILGPGVNIKRHPLGGRNFEYFSEDPFLTGKLASGLIEGIQSEGIGTSIKHFAVNNHETGRMVVDAIVDERTLREIYLPGFEIPIKESQPWTVMCSYNKVDGTYLSEHHRLLTEILRDEWGFDGIVMTDWGATNQRIEGIKAGLDLEMPASGRLNTDRIIKAVQSGELSNDELDACVTRLLALILKSRRLLNDNHQHSANEHHQVAKLAALEACVLLKNEQQNLPLSLSDKVGVIGALAKDTRYQGSGSSQINPTHLDQPLEAISLLNAGVEYVPGYKLKGATPKSFIDDAIALAENMDKIILIVGLTREYESEGFDRTHLDLPAGQIALIEALSLFHHKITLVLQNGAPVVLPDVSKIPSILETYLGGQAGASAVADILFGVCNPSGKLAETFPRRLEDVPSHAWFPGTNRQSQYREGIWVGYRFFNTARKPVAYPFGHGLSYTQFDYSNLVVANTDQLKPNHEMKVAVIATIKNTGDRAGSEVVQLYVGQQDPSVHRPTRELKAFCKVHLEAGQEQEVALSLDFRSFARWDTLISDWVVEAGSYTIDIGASVEDIRLSHIFHLDGTERIVDSDPLLRSYFQPANLDFNDAAFTALLGRSIPEPVPVRPFQFNSTLLEVEQNWLGRKLKQQVQKMMHSQFGEPSDHNKMVIEAIVAEMPLRTMVLMSQGKLSPKLMARLIHIMNGDWLKALLGLPISSR